MVKQLRKLLVQTLGFERYIRFVSRVYLRLVGAGWGGQSIRSCFFWRRSSGPALCASILALTWAITPWRCRGWLGPTGKVLAVEPIPAFQKIWQDNVRLSGHDNLTYCCPTRLGGKIPPCKWVRPSATACFTTA